MRSLGFFPGRAEVGWNSRTQDLAHLIWMFLNTHCDLLCTGRLIGTRFNVSDRAGTRGSLAFIATLLYAGDLTTMHLDCAIIQRATMSRKWNPP